MITLVAVLTGPDGRGFERGYRGEVIVVPTGSGPQVYHIHGATAANAWRHLEQTLAAIVAEGYRIADLPETKG